MTESGAETAAAAPDQPSRRPSRLKAWLRALYYGRERSGLVFRYCLLVFELVTVAYFVVTAMVQVEPWMHAIDLALAAVILLDMAARLWIARERWKVLFSVATLTDLIVVASLVVAFLGENLAFLRLLRALRILRSYRVLADLRERFLWFKNHEELLFSSLNLIVFIFVISAAVFVLQHQTNPAIVTFLDALYFTVTTLTTTGFGDITLTGSAGRFVAIVIMMVGVALFLRLLQVIFRPEKVNFECPNCGLKRHDRDAVHCKHCGDVVHIGTEGD